MGGGGCNIRKPVAKRQNLFTNLALKLLRWFDRNKRVHFEVVLVMVQSAFVIDNFVILRFILHHLPKCSVLHVMPAGVSCTNISFPCYIDNVALPVVDFVTDLGVTYDNKLKFQPHIDRIVSIQPCVPN